MLVYFRHINLGLEDLKGRLAKHRHQASNAIRVTELAAQDVHIVLEQAEYELRLGDPEVSPAILKQVHLINEDNQYFCLSPNIEGPRLCAKGNYVPP